MAHGAVQGGVSALGGGDFWSGAATGALSSWATSTFMAIPGVGNSVEGTLAFSGLLGGVTAEATGGNFRQGAGTALMVAGLNHLGGKLSYRWETVAKLKGTLARYGLSENTGCAYATVKSIAEYLGLELPADFKIKPVGAVLKDVIKEAGLSAAILMKVDDVIASINSDGYMIDVRNKIGHAVAIQEVQMKQTKGAPIFRFGLMDPDNGGSYQTRPESHMTKPTYYQIHK